ncbi:Na/Pi cotransporter family protein [Paenibacillus ginsengarvi]|uniref:Na/Pi cotransporter family protein n=1 Tax=Paenibacillus ginsengarvi TaxID=400777 RepID=A0A3B0CT78_9BACL|nr:Na/Pi symporter [Paenibacillus ginsengarvi]RKN86980.1 Na/Pi cotransporter family protein [Paenibacillus ginsengarvi]
MTTQIILPLLVGLGIFLTGMKIMELALHGWAGSYLTGLVETFTRTPVRGLFIGTGVTAVLQSSSALTVITIGLVNAGIMTFPKTLGIILGSNIGTCLTTELIGLNINKLAFPALLGSASIWLGSVALSSFVRSRRPQRALHHIRSLSLAVSGFSSVLLGVEVMQTIVPLLQSRGLFGWFVEHAQRSVLWGFAAGAILTAVIHSSAATIAMTMGLAAVDAIPVELGVAIVLGANVGTCVTALMAAIGGTRSGQFVAWAHISLNVGGALLFLPLLPLLHQASALFASSPSGQIAHAQTIFNVVSSLIALPFCYLPVFGGGPTAKRL